MNRDRESRPRLVSDGSFFGDSFSNLEIDDNVRILHNLGLDPAGNISPALAFQHDRDSRDRDRDNIRIFLKSLELWVSVRFCAMWRPDVTPSPYPQPSPPPHPPPEYIVIHINRFSGEGSKGRLLLVAYHSASPIGGERSDVSTLYSYVV